jgi:hypothetical protein
MGGLNAARCAFMPTQELHRTSHTELRWSPGQLHAPLANVGLTPDPPCPARIMVHRPRDSQGTPPSEPSPYDAYFNAMQMKEGSQDSAQLLPPRRCQCRPPRKSRPQTAAGAAARRLAWTGARPPAAAPARVPSTKCSRLRTSTPRACSACCGRAALVCGQHATQHAQHMPCRLCRRLWFTAGEVLVGACHSWARALLCSRTHGEVRQACTWLHSRCNIDEATCSTLAACSRGKPATQTPSCICPPFPGHPTVAGVA